MPIDYLLQAISEEAVLTLQRSCCLEWTYTVGITKTHHLLHPFWAIHSLQSHMAKGMFLPTQQSIGSQECYNTRSSSENYWPYIQQTNFINTELLELFPLQI